MEKSKTNYVSVLREEWETVKAMLRNIKISQNGVRNASVRPFGSGKSAGINFIIPKGGGARSIVPAKIVSKDGAFYIIDMYANGLDQAATATNLTAKVLMLNYASTLPAGTEIMVSSSYVIETGGG